MAMPFRKVWAVFQPFTFSRTAMLLDEFAEALSIPDHAVLTDIMGSREKNTYHIFTRQLGEKIPNAVWFPGTESDPETLDEQMQNFEQVTNYICDHAQAGDLVITHCLQRCQQGEQDDSGRTGTAAECEVTQQFVLFEKFPKYPLFNLRKMFV